jgi:hypothetical protein
MRRADAGARKIGGWPSFLSSVVAGLVPAIHAVIPLNHLGMGRRDKPGDDAIFINDDICLVF